MKRIKTVTIAVLMALVGLAVIAAPVQATDLPDSTPTIEGFNVYRNVLETGDWLLLIYANIPYTTIPDEPVSQTFIWRFISTDNVTEFGAATSNSWNENGHGYNLTSMYWDAGNVTARGMTWDTAYTIRLSGNPSAFASPPEYNYTLSAADYSTANATEDVRTELGLGILNTGADLDVRWGLGAAYSLLSQTEAGTVLSIYGEAFFRMAIYGLQGMCPQIFAYVIEDLDLEPRTWSITYITYLENQYVGTWVDTAKGAGAALFGTDFDLTSMIIAILACAGIGICSIILSGDAWHGVADARTGLIAVTRLGFFQLGFLAVLVAVALLYGAARLWGVFK